jgi:hypothetical protein
MQITYTEQEERSTQNLATEINQVCIYDLIRRGMKIQIRTISVNVFLMLQNVAFEIAAFYMLSSLTHHLLQSHCFTIFNITEMRVCQIMHVMVNSSLMGIFVTVGFY